MDNKQFSDKERLYIDAGDQERAKICSALTKSDGEWEPVFNERELNEIMFAIEYATNFNHGTAGHNRLLLIYKMCLVLDVMEKDND